MFIVHVPQISQFGVSDLIKFEHNIHSTSFTEAEFLCFENLIFGRKH